MITTKDHGPFGIEIICEPDDEYEYFRCDSSLAGLFYLRHKDGLVNIFFVKSDGSGYWSEESFEYSKMKNRDTCIITRVTERISDTKLTKAQYDAIRNN